MVSMKDRMVPKLTSFLQYIILGVLKGAKNGVNCVVDGRNGVKLIMGNLS